MIGEGYCSTGTVHITEAELARDLHAILAKVQQGAEVVVEQDHRPVAVLRHPNRSGQLNSDLLREARQRTTVTLDEDLGKDLEEIIAIQRQPWDLPSRDQARFLQFLEGVVLGGISKTIPS